MVVEEENEADLSTSHFKNLARIFEIQICENFIPNSVCLADLFFMSVA